MWLESSDRALSCRSDVEGLARSDGRALGGVRDVPLSSRSLPSRSHSITADFSLPTGLAVAKEAGAFLALLLEGGREGGKAKPPPFLKVLLSRLKSSQKRERGGWAGASTFCPFTDHQHHGLDGRFKACEFGRRMSWCRLGVLLPHKARHHQPLFEAASTDFIRS